MNFLEIQNPGWKFLKKRGKTTFFQRQTWDSLHRLNPRFFQNEYPYNIYSPFFWLVRTRGFDFLLLQRKIQQQLFRGHLGKCVKTGDLISVSCAAAAQGNGALGGRRHSAKSTCRFGVAIEDLIQPITATNSSSCVLYIYITDIDNRISMMYAQCVYTYTYKFQRGYIMHMHKKHVSVYIVHNIWMFPKIVVPPNHQC